MDRTVRTECWMFGELIETVDVFHEIETFTIPEPVDPGPDIQGEGVFSFLDHTWRVIKDDDEHHWGFEQEIIDPSRGPCPRGRGPDPLEENPDGIFIPSNLRLVFFGGGKVEWLDRHRALNAANTRALVEQMGWDLDGEGMPLQPAQAFSIAKLQAENKMLMAHVMVDLRVFKSVGEAKRNGWDKPLVEGDFTVTKKKIRFRIVS